MIKRFIHILLACAGLSIGLNAEAVGIPQAGVSKGGPIKSVLRTVIVQDDAPPYPPYPKPFPGRPNDAPPYPPYPKPFPGRPTIPSHRVPPFFEQDTRELLKKAKMYSLGFTEEMELIQAQADIKELKTTFAAPPQPLPVVADDPGFADPSFLIPSIDAGLSMVRSRLDTLEAEQQFVRRLMPFANLIKIQHDHLADLDAAIQMKMNAPSLTSINKELEAGQMVDLTYFNKRRRAESAVDRMFEPHRYLTKSFVNGTPAPEFEFKYCIIKSGIRHVGMEAECECSAQSVLERLDKTANSCQKPLTHFVTQVERFDESWPDSMELQVSSYSANLNELSQIASVALQRFTESVAVLDQSLAPVINDVISVINQQVHHLMQSKTKQQNLKATLDAANAKLAQAQKELVTATAAADAADDRVNAAHNQSADAWVRAEIAEQKAAEAEAAESAYMSPNIATCKGPWRPNCSSNVSVQRGADEEQQEYLDKLSQLASITAADRTAAMNALLQVVTLNAAEVDANVTFAKAKGEEMNALGIVGKATAASQEAQAAFDEYSVLVQKAESKTSELIRALDDLKARRHAILAAPPMITLVED